MWDIKYYSNFHFCIVGISQMQFLSSFIFPVMKSKFQILVCQNSRWLIIMFNYRCLPKFVTTVSNVSSLCKDFLSKSSSYCFFTGSKVELP